MKRNFHTVTPDDPWYVDPTNTLDVMLYVRAHVDGSESCTHGHGFTYDFCPIANGNLDKAIEHLENIKEKRFKDANDHEKKRDALRNAGYIVGTRDKTRNIEFAGGYMVATEESGGYCIVGDSLDDLIDEAYNHLFL